MGDHALYAAPQIMQNVVKQTQYSILCNLDPRLGSDAGSEATTAES
jgi:hypothetical protein